MDGTPQMRDMKRSLREFGIEMEAITIAGNSALAGGTVGEAERRGLGAFIIIQIERANGKIIRRPGEDVRIEAEDKVILVIRSSKVSAGAIFSTPKGRIRVGRTQF